MRIVLWNGLIGDALAAGLGVEAERAAPHEAARLLAGGAADVALVPTLAVLRNPEDFAVVPGVGVVASAWPFARLLVKGPPGQVKSVGFDPVHAQEVLLAQVVFREAFGSTPVFRPYPQPDAATLLAENDAALVVTEAPVPGEAERVEGMWALDPGHEWFDLTTRPFVWGLLAARSGALPIPQAQALHAIAQQANARKAAWLQTQSFPPALHDWLAADLHFDLGGYALPGLDAFADFLYYHGALPEVPDVPFIKLPKEEGDDGPPTTADRSHGVFRGDLSGPEGGDGEMVGGE